MKSCPLCGGSAETMQSLFAPFLREQLERYFGARLPGEVIVADYALLRCASCGLVFADPMLPGSAAFYRWIASQAGYYAAVRWEWNEVIRRVLPGHGKRLLEVGCGSGRFLELLRAGTAAEGFGLDITESAVQACREKGIRAQCQTLEAFEAAGDSGFGTFDFVAAFHCLEHVSDPVSFVSRLLNGLSAKGGTLFLSTPLSPMSVESGWFDPLNHPPHHLTRWNPDSFRALAARVQCDLELAYPPALPARTRSRAALRARHGWTSRLLNPAVRRLVGLALPLLHPLEATDIFLDQRQRFRVGGQTAPDLMLAVFTRKGSTGGL